jgi:glycosyltransferase involved in cell wall biosynthesis
MKIVVAHPGTQHTHHVVAGLLRAGIDVSYHTIMQFGYNSRWAGLLPKNLYDRRSLKTISDKVITRYPFLEGVPRFLAALGISDTQAYATRNRMFQRKISSNVIASASVVLGFDSSSLTLARRCRDAGVPFFLELTTPHSLEKQKWTEYVNKNFPLWPSDVLNKSHDLIRDEDEEVEAASVVSAPTTYVGATHYKYSYTQKKIVINPFGADVSAFRPKPSYQKTNPKFVFMGAINAAKGLPVLLEAWRLAKPDATLTIAGHGEIPRNVTLPPGVSFVGRIQKHDREAFLHSADVFVCPSLYEGLALVQLEAAACGLAVLGTHNSGGSQFLDNELSGYFVEAGNPAALAEKIDRLTNDSVLRESMGRKAAVRAREYTWDAYTARWLQMITTTLSEQRRR